MRSPNPNASTQVLSNQTSQDSNSSSVQFIEASVSKKPYVATILIASASDNDLSRLSELPTPPCKSPTTPGSFDLNIKSNLQVFVLQTPPENTTPPVPEYTAQDLSNVILQTSKQTNSLENSQNSSIVAERSEIDDFDFSGISKLLKKPIIQAGKAWRRSFMKYKNAKEKLSTDEKPDVSGSDLANICEESRRFSCMVLPTNDIERSKRRLSLQTFALSGN